MKRCEFNKEKREIGIAIDAEFTYPVDLTTCKSSAEMLDWIFQVSEKTWCDGALLKEFIDTIQEACEEVFGDSAQGVFCASGKDHNVRWETGFRALVK